MSLDLLSPLTESYDKMDAEVKLSCVLFVSLIWRTQCTLVTVDRYCDNTPLCKLNYEKPGTYTFERWNYYVQRIEIEPRFSDSVLDLTKVPNVSDVFVPDYRGISDPCEIIKHGCANVHLTTSKPQESQLCCKGNEMSTTTTITKMPTKISTPATPTSTTTTITKMPIKISTSATPTTASTASKIVSSHVVSIIMSTLRTPIATTTTKISTPMPSTSNNTSMITASFGTSLAALLSVLIVLVVCHVLKVIKLNKLKFDFRNLTLSMETSARTRINSTTLSEISLDENERPKTPTRSLSEPNVYVQSVPHRYPTRYQKRLEIV